jgi:signal transduction histidine kinase
VAGAIAESIDGLERVTQIVRALKEFSHQGRGGRERIDINQMIENAITLTRNEWKFVAAFERDLAPGLPPVAAAGYECGQLLVNLIVNAAHAVLAASAAGRKGVISARTRLVNGQIEIRVSDTGTGIPPEIRDRIFEPFFTTKSVGKGTGQGLATARAIVERHGGSIDFETEMGCGTTFVVRFPTAPGRSRRLTRPVGRSRQPVDNFVCNRCTSVASVLAGRRGACLRGPSSPAPSTLHP